MINAALASKSHWFGVAVVAVCTAVILLRPSRAKSSGTKSSGAPAAEAAPRVRPSPPDLGSDQDLPAARGAVRVPRNAGLRRASTASTSKGRRISLALQGGGSFGAFTWGVLDRLLEDDDLTIDAVSGASAGSVNSVVMAAGWIAGGRPEARRRLDRFWKRSSDPAPPNFGTAASVFADMTSRWMSPYQVNPFNHDVLDRLLGEAVDFDALRSRPPFKLLVAATSVADGAMRLFRETELTREMVLASGCLPMKAHAVEIAGTRYWDGGYSANPALIPLVEVSETPDLLVVQVMPGRGEEWPRSAPDIVRRLEQVTFNGALQREMTALATMMDLAAIAADGPELADRLRRLRLHHLSAEDHHPSLGEESTTDLSWRFLLRLRAAGRAAAESWLDSGARDGLRAPLRAAG